MKFDKTENEYYYKKGRLDSLDSLLPYLSPNISVNDIKDRVQRRIEIYELHLEKIEEDLADSKRDAWEKIIKEVAEMILNDVPPGVMSFRMEYLINNMPEDISPDKERLREVFDKAMNKANKHAGCGLEQKQYEKDILKKGVGDLAEMTAGELMKKMIKYLLSDAPESLMKFMIEQWSETVNEVEESKNVDRSMYKMRIEPAAGSKINECAQDAQELADSLDKEVFFTFNGTECVCLPNGHVEKLVECFNLIRRKDILTTSIASSKGIKPKFK